VVGTGASAIDLSVHPSLSRRRAELRTGAWTEEGAILKQLSMIPKSGFPVFG
jgi:hypothetical protein